jgi:uncharacterized membrane protein YgcG
MNRIRQIIPMLLLGLCAGLTPAYAMNSVIRDDGEFFSAEAKAKANEEIAAIRKKFNKDLIIETYATAPDFPQDATETQKKEYFEKWAGARDKAVGTDGIFVLICRQPAYVQAGVNLGTQRLGFSIQDRNKLRDILIAGFKDKKYDSALIDATSYVSTTLARGPGANQTTPGGAAPIVRKSGGSSVFGIVVLVLCVFIGIMVVRAIFGALQGGHASGAGMGGGGGGFFSSMLGGIGGALLGNYLYDRMTDHSHSGDVNAGVDTSHDSDPGSSDFSDGGGSFDSGGDSGGGSFE